MQHINECVLLMSLETVLLNKDLIVQAALLNERWKWLVPGRANKHDTSWLQAGAAASKGVGSFTIAGGLQATDVVIGS